MDLPQDVIFKILLKLPVRSLLRFKCVCKDWRGLIESSLFKDSYLALRRAKAMDDEVVGLKLKRYEFGIYKSFVTCWYEDYEPLALSASAPSSSSSNDVEISGNPRSGPSTIIDHFNGIVCVKGGNRGNYWEDNMRVNWFDITLVNPALREFRKLPVPDLGGDYECYVRNIGFGYDDATNDYKVFAMVSVVDLGYEKIGLVYHLSTNSWRILGNMSEFVFHNYMTVDGEFILCMTDDSVFSHGSIHCIMRSDPNYRLLAFNLTTESFQEMLFPRGWSYDDEDDQTVATRLLTIDKSTIALVAFTYATSAVIHVFDIWVMKEYGDTESWTKLYSISSLPRFVTPLSFWRKDKLLLKTVDSRLICYDLFTGQVYEYEECDPIAGSYDQLSSKGQQQEDGHCDDPICGPLGWGLKFVTGHESFVSLNKV